MSRTDGAGALMAPHPTPEPQAPLQPRTWLPQTPLGIYILSPFPETDSGVRGDDRVADLFQSTQVLGDSHAI